MHRDELKKQLTSIQYHVTCENGTERPFANEYWNNTMDGLYVDIISGRPLFSSRDKFDSGTGWPSFTRPVDKNEISMNIDNSHMMVRTEVSGRSSGGHLGHVFTDGPEPTGLRYCINSAAMRFVPVEDLAKEGYGEYSHLFSENRTQKKDLAETEKAALGAGCFWGVEHILKGIKGVIDTETGYMGGTVKNPDYRTVSRGDTGHAEVVLVTFDPKVLPYGELLGYFWRLHDPTQVNRQGHDTGTQYRSVVFYYTDRQKETALISKAAFDSSGLFRKKAATEIIKAGEFYRAEEYHQDYYDKNNGRVCHVLRDR